MATNETATECVAVSLSRPPISRRADAQTRSRRWRFSDAEGSTCSDPSVSADVTSVAASNDPEGVPLPKGWSAIIVGQALQHQYSAGNARIPLVIPMCARLDNLEAATFVQTARRVAGSGRE